MNILSVARRHTGLVAATLVAVIIGGEVLYFWPLIVFAKTVLWP